MSNIEAVLLSGGRSSRMGMDKSQLPVKGEPSAQRIRRLIEGSGIPVTELGSRGIPDRTEFGGPLLALADFDPKAEIVFLFSCDLPLFDPYLIQFLEAKMGDFDCCIPEIQGRKQFLCACYRATTFAQLRILVQNGARAIRDWAEQLNFRIVLDAEFQNTRLDPRCCIGANTLEEWQKLLHG